MSQFIKRVLLLLVAVAMLPAALYGCTDGTGIGGNNAASAESDRLSDGSSVTVGISQDLDSLDPPKAVNAGPHEGLFNIFEGLMKASPDGGVIPAVASDYEISTDGTQYIFTLRKGVMFHNGNEVTLDDVLYSLKRCAGSENDGVPLMSAFTNVTGVDADEQGRVVVTLSEPSLEFLNSMTAAIIPADTGNQQATAPVGTGPFRFVSYTPQSSMEMTRFDGYWGTQAHLENVTFKILSDTNTLVMGLNGGTLDMVVHMPNTLAGSVSSNFTVLKDTMKLVQALYINNDVEPFDDIRVRQAMYYAINVPEIIDFVCDGAGVATGTSMYPAFTKYFVAELAEVYQQNLDKAKQLLTEAGYPGGFEMTITVPSNYTQHVDTGLVLAQQLSAVGITANVEEVAWETWVSDVYKGRNYQTTVSGIAASDMTAREMLVRYTTDHSKNFINFSDEEFDDAVARAMATMDMDEQVTLYKRAQEILNEQAASLWLQDLCDLAVLRPELDGMVFYATYVLDMSTIYYK
ncbi:MAG: ABC transporter substrate-binding protein [Clostridia bacterium]|nr:ABC transporter substrate-binding protein [Clostridia bacterium]